ncbi:hypothetical protein KY360_03185 [Candidatus Woesearchaeota archaeon]|nr:hypothetical protein [Candidatus Woesearchaeota archaeon]
MAFISIREIIDIIIMVFAIGYIFSGFFKRTPHEGYDPIKYFSKSMGWENIKHAAMIAAPAVVLHELAHKIVAMSYGAIAILKAPYLMYGIVIALRAMNFPLVFFVGGYVAHSPLPALPSAFVSVAGPLTNFIVWFLIQTAIKHNVLRKYHSIMAPMAKINLFLGIFNMLPIPGFDGFNFFRSLFSAFM